MSIIDCLTAALTSEGKSSSFKKTVSEMKDELEAHKASMPSEGYGLTEELKAAEAIYNARMAKHSQSLKQTAMHVDVVEKSLSRFKEGLDNPVDAVRSLLTTSEGDIFKHGGFGLSAQDAIRSNQRIFTGLATDVLDKLNPKKLGYLKDPSKQLDIKRDLYAALRGQGARSDDPTITSIVDSIANVIKHGEESFVKAGGNSLGQKSSMLGRSFSLDKVAKFKRDEYIQDGLKAFDLDMARQATGGVIKNAEDMAIALGKDYDSILSGGINNLSDMAPDGMKNVMSSQNHKRIFVFADGDADTLWHAKYGEDSLYSRVVDYANTVGKEIGLLQTLGPKPDALIRTMMKEAARLNPEKAREFKDVVNREFRYVTGQWDRGLNPTVAKWMATHRASQAANKLGFTAVDAVIGDMVALNSIASNMRGIPALKSIVDDLIMLAKPGVKKNYKALAEMGLHAEAFIDDTQALLKGMETEGAHKFFSSAARGVMKWTGNTRATNVSRTVKVKQISNMLAELKGFEDNPEFGAWLQGIGLTKETLAIAQQFGVEKHPTFDIDMISPVKLYEAGYEKEAAEIGAVFGRAVEVFSPVSSDRFRAFTSSAERGGKAIQIAVGSAKGFTGYVSSFFVNHMAAMWYAPGSKLSKAKLYASASVAMVLAGVTQQLVRDVLLGKDPELNSATIWKGIQRSGMLSVAGDMIANGGGGIGDPTQLARLLGGTLVGNADLAIAAGAAAIHGDTKKALRHGQKLVDQYVPGKNAWFAAAAYNRLIQDQIKFLYDPNAAKNFKNRAKKAERQGQAMWWKPGEVLPSRAPDMDLTDRNFLPPEPKSRSKKASAAVEAPASGPMPSSAQGPAPASAPKPKKAKSDKPKRKHRRTRPYTEEELRDQLEKKRERAEYFEDRAKKPKRKHRRTRPLDQ